MKSRPAETAGGAGSGVVALAVAVGASRPVVAVVGVLAGLVPALVTLLVNTGGIRGAITLIWKGRQS